MTDSITDDMKLEQCYRYYIPKGRSAQTVLDIRKAHEERKKEAMSIARNISSEGPVYNTRVLGFLFKNDEPPKGWTKGGTTYDFADPRPYFVPPKKDKTLRRRMNSLDLLVTDLLQRDFSESYIINGPNNTVLVAGIENHNGVDIIRLPRQWDGYSFGEPKKDPLDAIKMSVDEYWKMIMHG